MDISLKIWRQNEPLEEGSYAYYELKDIDPEARLLDVLETLNDKLVDYGFREVFYGRSCIEGVCGYCGMMINDRVDTTYGGKTACKLLIKEIVPQKDGGVITLKLLRHLSPIRDLAPNKTEFEKIVTYLSAGTQSTAPPIRAQRTDPEKQRMAILANSCINCLRCVATCPNKSPKLYVAARVVALANQPTGQAGLAEKILEAVQTMDGLDVGDCSNTRVCEAVCPVGIPHDFVGQLDREYFKALIKKKF